MDNSLDAQIRRSRKRLQNPYAYLDGDGGYSVVPPSSTPDVHEARSDLENPYAYLDGDGGYGEFISRVHSRKPRVSGAHPEDFLGKKRKGGRFSKREIEGIVRNLQLEIWAKRELIWPDQKNISPIEVLDPTVALHVLGYRVDMRESLGQYSGDGELFEVAGTVNDEQKRVEVSRRFAPEIRNFTTAHELAHVVLHRAHGLHRDRALDGGAGNAAREEREVEADIFAAYFLMPEKQIRIAFERVFHTRHFTITDETAFALISNNSDALEKKCRTLRDLAKLLASTEQYGGQHFESLCRQFRTSTEAMAIRLEELGLVTR